MKLKHSTHAAAASVVALSLSLLASLSAQQSRLEVAAAVGARSDNPPAEVQDEAARQTAEKRRYPVTAAARVSAPVPVVVEVSRTRSAHTSAI